MSTKVSQLLFNSLLPEKFRDYRMNFHDPKAVKSLLERMAVELPADQYRDILRDVYKLGADVSYYEGTSFSLDDLRPPPIVRKRRADLSDRVNQILKRRDLPAEARNKAVVSEVSKAIDGLKKSMIDEATGLDSGLALQVNSHSRGKVDDLQSLLIGDMLMSDAQDKIVPVPMLHGYSEGVDPAEFWAGVQGTRVGLLNVKLCLSGDTHVALAGGGYREIRDVSTGDIVLGSDRYGNLSPVRVVGKYEHGAQDLVRFTLQDPMNGRTVAVTCTSTHRFLSAPVSGPRSSVVSYELSDIIPVGDDRLISGQWAVLARGNDGHSIEPRLLAELEKIGPHPTYDLSVDNRDHLYVLSNGLITSNSTADAGYLCLHGDTMVRMGDGSQRLITDIKVDDIVMGADLDGSSFPVRVTSVFSNGRRPVYSYKFRIGRSRRASLEIKATENHKVLSRLARGKHSTYGELRPLSMSSMYGFNLITTIAGEGPRPVSAKLLDRMYVGEEETYDIEVDHPDHLFVLANGAIVSNSKKLKQAAHRQVVTTPDCGTLGSIDAETSDPDNVGCILAADVEGYKRGTPVSVSMMKKIKAKTIPVRSPVTCDAPDGLCAKCVGIRETGRLPEVGENIGMPAAQAIGERSTQTALCLDADTRVYVVDVGDIRIRDIQAGDVVLASDKWGNRTPTKVIALHDNGEREVFKYTADNGSFVICTPDHKVLTGRNRILPISECRIKPSGTHTDPGDTGLVSCESMGLRPTFDIEIDTEDHLFVLSNGMIVSNSSKHSAGRTSGKEKRFVNGFKLIEQLVDVPQSFQDAAAVAELDGSVESIEDAPQGGKFVTISGKKHYIHSKMAPTVKVGDDVEAGDLISDGLTNPSDMVKYKGLGETRRLFVDQFRKATGANRRNVEVLAKSFVDYIKVNDPEAYPNAAPDDVVKYSDFAKAWTPRKGVRSMTPTTAVGKYLEVPAAHYTIGTRITRRVAKDLAGRGWSKIDVHDEEAPFTPVMVPSVRALTHAADWQERMGGYHLKNSLIDAAERGMTSDLHSSSYIPAIMRGTDFADDLGTTGKY